MFTEKRLLLSRDFALIWWSQVLSQVADGVSRLALLWFVYSVTGSALKTSVIGLLQTLSPILFGPLIGVTVDRLPKKAILIVTDVTRGILIGLIPCVLSIEVFTVDMLYLLVFLYGIATAMFVPTLSSSVPFLVDRPRFVAANAMLQSTTSIGIIIGPVLSGLGIAFAGSQEVLCANAVDLFCVGALSGADQAAVEQAIASAGQCGFRDVPGPDGRHSIFAVLPTDHSGADSLGIPLYVRGRRLHDVVSGLWQEDAGLGPGGSGLSLVLARHRLVSGLPCSRAVDTMGRSQAPPSHRVSSVIGGAALCGLVWTHSLVVATVLVTIVGMGLGTWTPIAWGMIQEFSPAEMVGRVMAIYTAIATATSLVGISFFGWMTELANEYTSVIGIGCVCFAWSRGSVV